MIPVPAKGGRPAHPEYSRTQPASVYIGFGQKAWIDRYLPGRRSQYVRWLFQTYIDMAGGGAPDVDEIATLKDDLLFKRVPEARKVQVAVSLPAAQLEWCDKYFPRLRSTLIRRLIDLHLTIVGDEPDVEALVAELDREDPAWWGPRGKNSRRKPAKWYQVSKQAE